MNQTTCRFAVHKPEEVFCAKALDLFDTRSEAWCNPAREAAADLDVPVGMLWITSRVPGAYEAIEMEIPDMITTRGTGADGFRIETDPLAFYRLDEEIKDTFARPVLEMANAPSGLCLLHEDFRAEAYYCEKSANFFSTRQPQRSHLLGRGALSIYDFARIDGLRAADDYAAIAHSIITIDLSSAAGQQHSNHKRRRMRTRLDQHFAMLCALTDLDPDRIGLPQ